MKQKSGPDKAPAERVVKDIRRQTRRQYSAEDKIGIVLEGLRGILVPGLQRSLCHCAAIKCSAPPHALGASPRLPYFFDLSHVR